MNKLSMFQIIKNEGNEKKFRSDGFSCEIKRHPSLFYLCGYVCIPETHSLFGLGYNKLYEIDINVHGGLTYAKKEGDMWKIGFDCAHLGDLIPSEIIHGYSSGDGIYRDMKYVEHETRNLAKQLKKLSSYKES